MRLRFAMLCAALSALALVAVPGLAGVSPRHNRGLTINATPNPINAGDGLYIYGQLNNPPLGGQTILLFRRIDGSNNGFVQVGQTQTKSSGFYSFTRPEGYIDTNRDYYVRVKRREWASYHEQVTPWEVERYLTLT